MRFKALSVVALSLVASAAVTGCIGLDLPDYLRINALVTASDGVTPIANAKINGYDWYVHFYDGTEANIPIYFTNSSGFGFARTGINGRIDAETFDLDFQSEDGYCYKTCVLRDSDGWCLQRAVDCTNYTLNVGDIDYSDALLSIQFGLNTLNVIGQEAHLFNPLELRTGTITDGGTTYLQNDIFVTIVSPNAGSATGAANPIDAVSGAGEIPAGAKGVNVPAAIEVKYADLNDADKAKVDAVRAHFTTEPGKK